MSAFSAASIAAWAVAVGAAALVRGRRGAIAVGILLGIYTLVATTLARHAGLLLPLFAYAHATVYANFVFLARVGAVEILGFDFRRRDRKVHVEEISARHPRSDALRVALLHDPGAFRHLPEGTADLVLSGHTHGGQLGLLWVGLPHTILSALTGIPDHGLWSRGGDFSTSIAERATTAFRCAWACRPRKASSSCTGHRRALFPGKERMQRLAGLGQIVASCLTELRTRLL